MSYAVRNTLILLVVLTTIVGAGWSYIYFYQQPRLEELKVQTEKTRQDLQSKQQIANQYPVLLNRFEEATKFFNNYNKALYPGNNEDAVFDFLNTINTGSSYTDFTFSFSDSTVQDKFGTMSINVTGQGYYRNFINFIRRIELSKPLNKIAGVQLSPINELESYGKVNFNFSITSFYDRSKLLGKPDMTITNNILGSVYNPFYPLIRSVKPNSEGLINIEQSTLLAISGNEVFLLDQNGVMKNLSKGDDVFLGELSSINISNGTASFVLNKGGIIERVTLKVNNDEKQND